VRPAPRANRQLLRATAPLAVLHAAGFLLTNMSLGKVSVAFTHTVKSTEPFFSVALTPSILGEVPTWGIVMSLFPIVAGVALASLTEVSFNWIGFLAAVGSNLALQGRNVLSKKLMSAAAAGAGSGDGSGGSGGRGAVETPEEIEEDTFRRLDNINLFSTMTILAFVLLLPLALALEGAPLLGAAAAPAVTGMSSALLGRKLVLGGVCRCLDVLASYMILQRVSPVTHSVGNCVKRAVVIAMSIVIFRTPMSILNVVGTLLALAGVFVYSMVVSACKHNSFGPESPLCKPIYEMEVELTEGGGI
jgi:solute carrier family 35, member E1